MRLVVKVLLVIAFFYGCYTAFMAVWSYIQLNGVVDRAYEDHGRAGAVSMRAAIIKGASDAGVPIDERLVVVREEERALLVNLRWSWPVVTYQGEQIVEIPLSMERAYSRP